MTIEIQGLYKLSEKDASRAGSVLADAFKGDPVWGRVFEREFSYPRKIGGWFEGAVRYCLKYGAVYAPSERLEGIACTVPGELSYMTMWRMIRSGSMKAGMKMGLSMSMNAAKMRAVFTPLESDRRANMKDRTYLYFMSLGVARAFQGQGFGTILINAITDQCDQNGLPIYLETETQRNVNMYEGHGFRVVKRITLPIINQPMWEMVRECHPDQASGK